MAIPQTYSTNTNAIVSYDSTDLAEGTGIVELNAFGSDSNGSAIFRSLSKSVMATGLAPYILESGLGCYPTMTARATAGAGTYSTAVDFALSPFNTAKIIKGTAWVAFTWGMQGNALETGKVRVSLLKNSTVIASTLTAQEGGTDVVYTSLVPITIPNTFYAVGDVLTLRLEGYQVGAYSITWFFYHDPLNKDFSSLGIPVTATTNHTELKFYVPFRIDL